MLWWRKKKEPTKPEPRYYINWDEVKTVKDIKTLIMALPGARWQIDEYTAKEILQANYKLVRKVED